MRRVDVDLSSALEDPSVPPAVRALAASRGGRYSTAWREDGNALRPLVLRLAVRDCRRGEGAAALCEGALREPGAAEESPGVVVWRERTPPEPATFRVARRGPGGEAAHVADGVRWHDGTVSLRRRDGGDPRPVSCASVAEAAGALGCGPEARVEWYPRAWVGPLGVVETLEYPGAVVGDEPPGCAP